MESPDVTTVQRKSFIKRFWWIFLLVPICIPLLFLGFNYFTGGATRIVAQFNPHTGGGFYSNPPTIVNDYLYIGTSANSNIPIKDNYLFKLDLDLKKIWEYKLPDYNEVEGGVVMDSKGNLYFVVSESTKDKTSTQRAYLYSLTNDGVLRWKNEITVDDVTFQSGPVTPAIGKDDTIYIGYSKIFAFYPDGTSKWVYPEDNRLFVGLRSSPIIDNDNNLYVVGPELTYGDETEIFKIYKFLSGQNTPIWETELDSNMIVLGGENMWKPRSIPSSPAFTKNQTKIISAIGNTINAVDTENGNLVWSFKPEGVAGMFEASPSIDDKDNIYIGTKASEESVLYAIKSDGSGLQWENHVGSDLYCSPTLGEGNILYVGSEYTGSDGTFHVIDINTGEYLWNIDIKIGLKDFQKTAPAIYKGYAYVGVMVESIFGPLLKIKIDSQNYLPDAAWPRFHGGNSNNGRLE